MHQTFPTLLAILWACLSIFGMPGCNGPSAGPRQSAAEPLKLSGMEGASAEALYYPPPGPSAPGLIIVATRPIAESGWTLLAERAQAIGFGCAIVEALGNPAQAPGNNAQNNAAEPVYSLIRAAQGALVERGARKDALAIAAADEGTPLALRYAADTNGIQGAVLISPVEESLGVDSLDAIGDFSPRPLLLLTTQGDSYRAEIGRQLAEQAGKGFREIREFSGAARGAGVFIAHPNALEQSHLWLQTIFEPFLPHPNAPS